MSLDLFPSRAIIGYANFNGQRVPIEISPEFYRALRALVSRVGGASGGDVAQSEITDAFASCYNDDVIQFGDSIAQQSDNVIQAFADLFAPSNQLSHSFSDVLQPSQLEPLFSDVLQQAETPVLLPEIVQTSTDNSFANETTYA